MSCQWKWRSYDLPLLVCLLLEGLQAASHNGGQHNCMTHAHVLSDFLARLGLCLGVAYLDSAAAHLCSSMQASHGIAGICLVNQAGMFNEVPITCQGSKRTIKASRGIFAAQGVEHLHEVVSTPKPVTSTAESCWILQHMTLIMAIEST